MLKNIADYITSYINHADYSKPDEEYSESDDTLGTRTAGE